MGEIALQMILFEMKEGEVIIDEKGVRVSDELDVFLHQCALTEREETNFLESTALMLLGRDPETPRVDADVVISEVGSEELPLKEPFASGVEIVSPESVTGGISLHGEDPVDDAVTTSNDVGQVSTDGAVNDTTQASVDSADDKVAALQAVNAMANDIIAEVEAEYAALPIDRVTGEADIFASRCFEESSADGAEGAEAFLQAGPLQVGALVVELVVPEGHDDRGVITASQFPPQIGEFAVADSSGGEQLSDDAEGSSEPPDEDDDEDEYGDSDEESPEEDDELPDDGDADELHCEAACNESIPPTTVDELLSTDGSAQAEASQQPVTQAVASDDSCSGDGGDEKASNPSPVDALTIEEQLCVAFRDD
jgi:hypothetical protein